MATTTTQTTTPRTQAPRPPTTPSVGGRAGGYITEVQKEMRKVSWPKRQELLNNTVLTLVSALFLSVLIFGSDQIISWLLTLIYG
jgi:preprotein translocase subunit SecE